MKTNLMFPLFLLFLLIGAISLVFISCTTYDYYGDDASDADAAYLEEEALIIFEEWAEAIRNADTEWYLEYYHEDARKIILQPRGEMEILHGQDAIGGQIDSIFRNLGESLLSWEPPQPEYTINEEGLPRLVIRDAGGNITEILRFSLFDEELMIHEQWVITRHPGEIPPGDISQWADRDGNGVLHNHETEELFQSLKEIVGEGGSFPGERGEMPTEDGFARLFDWDFSGRLEPWESETAYYVLLRNRMRQIMEVAPPFAERYLDRDGDGIVSIHEANQVAHTLLTDPRELVGPAGPSADPERQELRFWDFNDDGFIEESEVAITRDLYIRMAALNRAPLLYTQDSPALTDHIRNWTDTNGDGRIHQQEQESFAFSLLDLFWGDVPAFTPVHRFFDRNRNGIVEAMESSWAREYLMSRYISGAADPDRSYYNDFLEGTEPIAPMALAITRLSPEEAERFIHLTGLGDEELPFPAEGEAAEILDLDGDGRLGSGELFAAKLFLARASADLWLDTDALQADTLDVRTVLDQAADTNGNGFLEPGERRAMALTFGEAHRVVSLFDRAVDFDGDGEVAPPELLQARETGFIPLADGGGAAATGFTGTGRSSRTGIAASSGTAETGSAAASGATGSGPVKQTSLRGKRLAVLGVRDLTETMARAETDMMVSFLENAFVNYGDSTVVDRQNLEKIMEEHSYQLSALVDEETAVEIGKLSGADAIAMGNVSLLGELYYLHLKVIDVTTGAIVGSSISQGKSQAEFLSMCNGAVQPLF